MSIWKRKSMSLLLAEASESEKGLKRTLTAWSLIALGIGAIIGAGLFVRTATAAAQNAGSICNNRIYCCCYWLCISRIMLCRTYLPLFQFQEVHIPTLMPLWVNF
jgi:amino acid permease